jgi:hypothetical protein
MKTRWNTSKVISFPAMDLYLPRQNIMTSEAWRTARSILRAFVYYSAVNLPILSIHASKYKCTLCATCLVKDCGLYN